MTRIRKILIADDETSLAEMYSIRFREDLFEVVIAADGEEAVQKAREERPDIILLDVVMPKKNGEEVIRELKKDPETADIPVIFLTNLGGAITDINIARAMGGDDLIIKSNAEPAMVLATVKKVLASKGF